MKHVRIGEQEDDPGETEQLPVKRELQGGDTKVEMSSNTGTKHWATGNFISVVTWQWLTPLFRTAKKRGLNDDDLYHILPVDSAEKNAKIFARLWEEEIERHGGDAVKASLRRVILRFVSWRILGSMIMVMISQLTIFLLSVSSFLLYKQRHYDIFQTTSDNTGKGRGGTQIWFGRVCAAEGGYLIPIFKGDFGRKYYQLFGFCIWNFHYGVIMGEILSGRK